MEAKEEGYYAAHLYTSMDFEVLQPTWDTKRIEMSVEIQVTTQLQEAIRRLLHKHYEQRRASEIVAAKKWQWDYQSGEFAANYLGHILHYLEGMIMEVRNRQDEVNK